MKLVVMIGPSPASRGGMASVIRILIEHGYGANGAERFLATQVDAGAVRKAATAALALARFLALLLCGRVALLHVHVASGRSFWRKAAFIVAARLFRRPVLFHLHGGQFSDFVDGTLSGYRQRLALAIIGASHTGFALTDASVAWLRTRAKLARVELFPNPVARPAAHASAHASACAPAHTRGRDVLYLGRLERQKGVFDLIHSFAAVHARYPDARLVLAGDGDLAAVRALAGQLDLGGALVLPGWVDAGQRATLMAEAALFVLPSHMEQMPMVVLEAMAAGVPVVATNVGAIPEMLAYGKCGTVVPVGDIVSLSASLIHILDNNILADTYSAKGLERIASHYLAETVLSRLRRRYMELVT